MAKVTLFLLLGIAVGSSLAQDCWWTGCQPNTWAVTGCDQYDREEKGREACRDGNGNQGNKYRCCERTSGGGGDGGGDPTVNWDEFSRAVTSNGYPGPSWEQFNNFNRYSKSVGKISSKQEAAMALAQYLHESDGLRAKREYACKDSQCPNEYRTGSCDAPGQYYYGRGYIQLSWCENYKAASNGIFGDERLVRDADLVARDDTVAWQTAFWYWGARVHDAPGVQQGKFGATTRAINGPLECDQGGHSGPAARFKLYGNVRQAFGLPGQGDPSGCR